MLINYHHQYVHHYFDGPGMLKLSFDDIAAFRVLARDKASSVLLVADDVKNLCRSSSVAQTIFKDELLAVAKAAEDKFIVDAVEDHE